jgi:quinol monooxygenase YgiN
MVLIEVGLIATVAQRDPLVSLLTQAMTGAQAEAGCLIYRFSVDLGNPLTFHLIELWQDEATLVAHLRGPHFANFMAHLPAVGRVTSSIARIGDLQPYRVPR